MVTLKRSKSLKFTDVNIFSKHPPCIIHYFYKNNTQNILLKITIPTSHIGGRGKLERRLKQLEDNGGVVQTLPPVQKTFPSVPRPRQTMSRQLKASRLRATGKGRPPARQPGTGRLPRQRSLGIVEAQQKLPLLSRSASPTRPFLLGPHIRQGPSTTTHI